jgi:hypothetical protein
VKKIPRHERTTIYDFFYQKNLQLIRNPRYLSIKYLKDFIQQCGKCDHIAAPIIKYILQIENEKQLSTYVFNLLTWESPDLFMVFLKACKYNDIKMIDLMLATNGEDFYRTLATNYNDIIGEKYFKYILNCDRVDKVISLLPQLKIIKIMNTNNLIEAIKKNNHSAVALYFSNDKYMSNNILRILKYVLKNRIFINDKMFNLLIQQTCRTFNYNDYCVFTQLGRCIDFGKFYDDDLVTKVDYVHIKRLGLLPESTIFDKMLIRNMYTVDIENGCIPSYYVACNNRAMLTKLHKRIDFLNLCSQLILSAYMSKSNDTFSYVFWTKNEHKLYACFLACINKWNEKMIIIIPREIIIKILEPIVNNFWNCIVN